MHYQVNWEVQLRRQVLESIAQGRMPPLPAVFLSSTQKGLEQLRIDLVAYLGKKGFDVEAFETEKKAHAGITDRMVKSVRRTEILLLLLGRHYGSLRRSGPRISATHFEWRTAREEKIPILHFLHSAHWRLWRTPQDPVTEACCEPQQLQFIEEIRQDDSDPHFLPLVDHNASVCDSVAERLWEFVQSAIEEENDDGGGAGTAGGASPLADGPSPREVRPAVRLDDVLLTIGKDLRALMSIVVGGGVGLLATFLAFAALSGRDVLTRPERLTLVATGFLVSVVIGGFAFFWRTRPAAGFEERS